MVDAVDPICVVIARSLERQGWSVLRASNAAEARARSEAHPGPIELVVSELCAGGVSGPDLVAELARKHPGVRAVITAASRCMDGCTDGTRVEMGTLLHKPFGPDALAAAVRSALEGPAVVHPARTPGPMGAARRTGTSS